MLGIAICTYNRAGALVELVDSLAKFTVEPHSIVVCDDGSSDSTVKVCDGLGLPVITGANRGVAANKNRGLHWLLTCTSASHMLIIEDDMLAIEQEWERHWIAAIDKWGHANWGDATYMRARPDRLLSGDGTVEDPFLAKLLTGCLMAFSRDGLGQVGYFDPRFGKYGHEHLELSRRFRRLGMGVEKRPNAEGSVDNYYVSIAGGMKMKTMPSESNKAVAEANRLLSESMAKDPVYRDPWLNDVDKAVLSTEIEVAARHMKG